MHFKINSRISSCLQVKEAKPVMTKVSSNEGVSNKKSSIHQVSAHLSKSERNHDDSMLKRTLSVGHRSDKEDLQNSTGNQSVRSQLERLNQKCLPFLQDFHKTFPSASGQSPRPSGADSDSHGVPSQLASLSISDISHTDTTMTRYVISEPDDPDSLQSMLREVQKMCSQSDPSSSSSILGKSTSQLRTDRCFGAKAWPHEQGTNKSGLKSSVSAETLRARSSGRKTNTTLGKVSRMNDFHKNRGPLHSSPETKGTRSSFGLKKGVQSERTGTKNTRRLNAKPRSPAIPDKSPNVSTAIAHYSDEKEETLQPDQDLSISSESSSGSSNKTPDANKKDGATSIQPLGKMCDFVLDSLSA